MRKLLLATVAGLAVSMSMAGYAAAQSADDSSGDAFPNPGQVTVRLNGRVRFYADYMGNTNQVQTNVAASSGTTGANGSGGAATNAGRNKIASYNFQTYARLYPGFDGRAANGLKYGAAMEIRTGNVNASNASSGANLTGAGGGLNGSISAQSVSRSTLYLRRTYGYFGTDQLGTIRVGETDGPTSLYETGTFENFADGNWNGDVYTALPTSQILVWPFSDTGNEYTTLKVVYLSPQFYGFDAGLSFEPNTANIDGGSGNGNTACSTGASIGCDELSSSPTQENQRRRNTGEALLRYRGTFGPVGLAVTGAYIGSSHVADDGTPRQAVQYQGLDLFDGGLAVTYAGLTVGGHVLTGTGNNTSSFALQKAHAKSELAWIAGASYTVGPVIVGASYIDIVSEGSNGNTTTGVDPTGQRREQGISIGGTYSVAPGFALFATYEWDQRKEGDYNFVTGATDAAHNKITGSILGVGTSFAW